MLRHLLGLIVLAFILAAPAQAGGTYVQAYGGANWDDVSIDTGHVVSKAEVGFVIGGTVGTKIDGVPGLRIEGDVSYRSNDLDTKICGTPLIVTDETWALMGNAVYDLPWSAGGIHPYVLAGAGYGHRTVGVDYTSLNIKNGGIVWQVGAGVNTEIAPGTRLGVGYRLFDAPDIDVAPTGGYHNAGINQAVVASLTFDM